MTLTRMKFLQKKNINPGHLWVYLQGLEILTSWTNSKRTSQEDVADAEEVKRLMKMTFLHTAQASQPREKHKIPLGRVGPF